MGVMAGVANGVMRTFHCDPEVITNIVPVDLAVNAMIACTWDIASQTDKRNEDMLIYNFTSTEEAPISWGRFGYGAASWIDQYPSEVACWYAVLRLSKFKSIYTLYTVSSLDTRLHRGLGISQCRTKAKVTKCLRESG